MSPPEYRLAVLLLEPEDEGGLLPGGAAGGDAGEARRGPRHHRHVGPVNTWNSTVQ